MLLFHIYSLYDRILLKKCLDIKCGVPKLTKIRTMTKPPRWWYKLCLQKEEKKERRLVRFDSCPVRAYYVFLYWWPRDGVRVRDKEKENRMLSIS